MVISDKSYPNLYSPAILESVHKAHAYCVMCTGIYRYTTYTVNF